MFMLISATQIIILILETYILIILQSQNMRQVLYKRDVFLAVAIDIIFKTYYENINN